jgi:hypothetical protein
VTALSASLNADFKMSARRALSGGGPDATCSLGVLPTNTGCAMSAENLYRHCRDDRLALDYRLGALEHRLHSPLGCGEVGGVEEAVEADRIEDVARFR